VSLRRLRLGELLALAGAICVIVALALPWYENAQGKLGAFSTFGPAVALLMLAAMGALALVFTNLAERSTALPVAAAVWGTLFGIAGGVAAVVRVLERPAHATMLCAGAWLALVGAVAILLGCWQSMRDERPQLYPPSDVEARPPPL
jgi:hypothetical protein